MQIVSHCGYTHWSILVIKLFAHSGMSFISVQSVVPSSHNYDTPLLEFL